MDKSRRSAGRIPKRLRPGPAADRGTVAAATGVGTSVTDLRQTPTRCPCPCSSWPRSAAPATPPKRCGSPPNWPGGPSNSGYRRFWVAEHHNMPAIASSAPAVLLAHLAASTDDHPARLGRRDAAQPRAAGRRRAVRHPGVAASGPDRPRHRARAGHRSTDCAGPAPHRRGPVGRGLPERAGRSDVDAGRRSGPAALGARRRRPCRRSGCWDRAASAPSWPACSGLPFSFAHHFSGQNTEPALELYRSTFRPSQWLDAPHAMIAVNVVCADTDERAEYLAKPGLLSFLRLRTGHPTALPTPEEAAAYQFTPPEQAFVEQRKAGQGLGSPKTVQAQLTDLLRRTGAGRAHDHQSGVRPGRPGPLL